MDLVDHVNKLINSGLKILKAKLRARRTCTMYNDIDVSLLSKF